MLQLGVPAHPSKSLQTIFEVTFLTKWHRQLCVSTRHARKL